MDKASTRSNNIPHDESDCKDAGRTASRSNLNNTLDNNQDLAYILSKTKSNESFIARQTTESICQQYDAIQNRLLETMPVVRPIALNAGHRLIARSLHEREARREGPSGLDRFFSSWSRQAVERNLRTKATATKEKEEEEVYEENSRSLKRKAALRELDDEKDSIFSNHKSQEWSQDELDRLLDFAKRWNPCNRNKRSMRRRKKRRVNPPTSAAIVAASPLEQREKAAVESVESDKLVTQMTAGCRREHSSVRPKENK